MNRELFKRWWVILMFLFITGFHNISNASSGFVHFERFFYGGYIGIELGLVNQFEGSPLLGYEFTPRIHGGVGAKYQYYYDKRLNNVFKAHLFGPLVFTDLIAIKNLDDLFSFSLIEGAVYIHAEMDLFSLPTRHFDINNVHPEKKRFFRPTWLTGIGLRREAGQNNFFHILLMLDVSADSPAVYSNPVLRFGFMF